MFMAAKRFLQHIDIHKVNIVLYVLIVALVVAYHDDLSWAVRKFPRYIRGTIDAPLERRLNVDAMKLLQADGDISPALPILEKSLSIDPHSEAVFWLGIYYFRGGDFDKALMQFARYRELDPAYVYTYLICARIYNVRKDPVNARRILREGMDFFSDSREYEPRKDPGVPEKFNRKADNIYKRCQESYQLLQKELQGIEEASSPSDKTPLRGHHR
jgi:tetratricopeptide (TPR) repeat protein